MKIYTKTGDNGDTSLFGGKRVVKNNLRIEAYGTVDELNASIGIAITESISDSVKSNLKKIQNDLFVIGSDLATPFDEKKVKIERIAADKITNLEDIIDSFDAELEPLKNFILPGGTKGSSILHLARTICRRAERRVVELTQMEQVNENIVKYLNRLSDLLFVIARFENSYNNVAEDEWGPY